MDSVDDIDIIIALNRAQEGFDWPWCEHALTVSARGSLTQIIQIIGIVRQHNFGKGCSTLFGCFRFHFVSSQADLFSFLISASAKRASSLFWNEL